jgi:hypothetical protein
MSAMDRRVAKECLVRVMTDPGAWAMGFVTSGNYIITAAHCIPRALDDRLARDDGAVVKVRRLQERGGILALITGVERCLDVAILSSSSASGTDLEGKLWEDYQRLMGNSEHAPLNLDEPDYGRTFDVHIYTHEGIWVSGSTAIHNPAQTGLSVRLKHASDRIRGGTSGSPAFDKKGRVVGIVSMSQENEADAHLVRLATTLPGWMLRVAESL